MKPVRIHVKRIVDGTHQHVREHERRLGTVRAVDAIQKRFETRKTCLVCIHAGSGRYVVGGFTIQHVQGEINGVCSVCVMNVRFM